MAEIRQLTPDDWEFLKSVRLEALADAPYAFGSTLAREQQFDEAEWRRHFGNAVWFVAAATDEEVGIAGGLILPSEFARELISMWVRDDFRGTNVAVDLVEAVDRWARNEGALDLVLWVTDGNERAVRFYSQAGFLPTGVRKPLASNPVNDELQLRRKLRDAHAETCKS